MKNVNPVNWFDITVSNLERAKSFYESVFDIKMFDFPTEWGKQSAFPSDREGMNVTGALVEKEGRVENGNNTVVYFESEDCTTEENRAESAGGKVLRPKMSIGEFGFVFMLQDTEGNVIGLHSRK